MKNFSETRPFFVRSALFVIMRATLSFRAISVNPVQWQNFELANLRKPDKMFEQRESRPRDTWSRPKAVRQTVDQRCGAPQVRPTYSGQ